MAETADAAPKKPKKTKGKKSEAKTDWGEGRPPPVDHSREIDQQINRLPQLIGKGISMIGAVGMIYIGYQDLHSREHVTSLLPLAIVVVGMGITWSNRDRPPDERP